MSRSLCSMTRCVESPLGVVGECSGDVASHVQDTPDVDPALVLNVEREYGYLVSGHVRSPGMSST